MKNGGFTLVEVLIALVIVAMSLGTFLQTGQSSVHQTFRVKNTMFAQLLIWNQLISEKEIKDEQYTFVKQLNKTNKKKITRVKITGHYQEKELSTLARFIYDP